MLKNNNYLCVYRNRFNDFDKDFFIPSYKESIKVNRGVGYFSLESLVLSFEGIIKYAKNDGHINLICNPELTDEDVEKIKKGIALNSMHVTDILKKKVEMYEASTDDALKLDIICNMISAGKIVIKIAYMPVGIYHEKFGIFFDEDGNKVYFNGSANETSNAKLRNMESFTVSVSWNGNEESIQNECNYFDELWKNQVDGIETFSFPEAVEEKIFEKYKKSTSIDESLEKYFNKDSSEKKKLYPYQQKAIEEFVKNNCCHFYEMATGTGKTFTSIETIKKLIEIKGKVFAMICVPQIDLQGQWEEALNDAGFEKVYLLGCESDTKKTNSELDNAIIDYHTGDESIICVAIYDTFFSKVYSSLNSIDELFVIFDEAHNINGGQFKKLPNAKYKLGLSATLQRFEESEVKRIVSYFTNDTISPYYYGIEDAIENGFLSKYEYHPLWVSLDEEDFERYKKKSKFLATLLNEKERDEDAISRTRMERILIIKQAKCKIEKLDSMIGKYDFENSVVYCGQGKDDDESIIDKVTLLLKNKGNYDVSQYTSKTINRRMVLKQFECSYYDVLVAIKCFDEGVDAPKLDKIYIMASDCSMRQTVQRRGRVLRKCKETGKTIAYIYDMAVIPPIGQIDGGKSLVLSELKRVREYARLAVNYDDVVKGINKYMETYGIEEEDFENEE